MTKYVILIFLLLPTLTIEAQKVEGDTIPVEHEVMDRYDSIIAQAAVAVSREEFNQAKEYYRQASFLRPTDPFPVTMIRNVENNIKAFAQRDIRDKDLRRKAEINTTLDNAMKEVMAKHYESARALYQHVLTLGPVKTQEEFAKQKIRAIDVALGGKNITTISAPPASTQVKEVTSATTFIASSPPATSQAKPSSPVNFSQASKSSTVATNNPLPSAKPKTDVEVLMDSALKAVADKNFESARRFYARIVSLHPNASLKDLAGKQIEAIDVELLNAMKKAVGKSESTAGVATPGQSNTNNETERIRDIEDSKKKAQLEALMDTAYVATKKRDWLGALNVYNQILALTPSTAREEFVRKEIAVINKKIESEQKTVVAVPVSSPPKPQAKPVQTTSSMPARDISSTGNNKNTSSQSKEPIYSTKQELNKGANASANKTPVVTQPTSIDLENKKQNSEFSQKMLSEASGLNISDSNNQVKLICQGIRVNGKNTFIKFLVQNQSPTEFVIGHQQLLYIKNYGILKRLDPSYLSEAQVVQSKKEFPLVYVAETPAGVEPDEVFVYEMEDQIRKTKLSINISGETFRQKKTD